MRDTECRAIFNQGGERSPASQPPAWRRRGEGGEIGRREPSSGDIRLVLLRRGQCPGIGGREEGGLAFRVRAGGRWRGVFDPTDRGDESAAPGLDAIGLDLGDTQPIADSFMPVVGGKQGKRADLPRQPSHGGLCRPRAENLQPTVAFSHEHDALRGRGMVSPEPRPSIDQGMAQGQEPRPRGRPEPGSHIPRGGRVQGDHE